MAQYDGTQLGADGNRYEIGDPNMPTEAPAPSGKAVTNGALATDSRITTVDRIVESLTREITDAKVLEGDATFESEAANFTDADIGAALSGAGLDGLTIESVTDENTVELSDEPTTGGRKVTDGVTTNLDATVASASAVFTTADIGSYLVSSAGVADGRKIESINSATSVELDGNASASGTGRTFWILPADTREVTIVRELDAVLDNVEERLVDLETP